MLRNFVKKPTFVSNNANSEQGDMDTSGFNLKRGSKQNSNRITPLDQSVHFDDEGDIMEKKIVYRPKTPDIDENRLRDFDSRTQKITSLITQQDDKIDLAEESKPVRETIKASFGVAYREDINDGGSANVRINGESYYKSPGRMMRRNELESKQKQERVSKV